MTMWSQKGNFGYLSFAHEIDFLRRRPNFHDKISMACDHSSLRKIHFCYLDLPKEEYLVTGAFRRPTKNWIDCLGAQLTS